jgi:hypothetical protein
MPYIPDDTPDRGLGAAVSAFEEPYHEYWYHLGRFIHAFAQSEAVLLALLGDISGLSKRRAGVLFSGTRAEAARDLINGFLDATQQAEIKKRLERPFGQMATIGTVRNNLVHWGATTDIPTGGTSFTVSNVSRTPVKPKEYTVSISDMKNMCRDLALIAVLLQLEIGSQDSMEILREGLAQMSWQYRPPQPSPRVKKERSGSPKIAAPNSLILVVTTILAPACPAVL